MEKKGGEFFKGEAHRPVLKRSDYDNLHRCQSQGNSEEEKEISLEASWKLSEL